MIEQAAILGVLNSSIFGDPEKAKAAAPYIARRLDALTEETDRGWQGQSPRHGFRFERTVRGVKEVAIIDPALLGSADARKLDEYAPSCRTPTSVQAHSDARMRRRRFMGRSRCSRP